MLKNAFEKKMILSKTQSFQEWSDETMYNLVTRTILCLNASNMQKRILTHKNQMHGPVLSSSSLLTSVRNPQSLRLALLLPMYNWICTDIFQKKKLCENNRVQVYFCWLLFLSLYYVFTLLLSHNSKASWFFSEDIWKCNI